MDMKLGSRSYWALLVLFLGVAIVRGWVSSNLEGSAPEFIQDPQRQERDLRITELYAEEGNQGQPTAEQSTSHLVGPAYIEAGPDGNLFVADEGAGELIKEFAPSGELLHSFHEYCAENVESVSDFVVQRDRLWVVDLLGRAIHVLDRNSGNWEALKLGFEPYRLALVEGDQRLTVQLIGQPKLFASASMHGEMHNSFGVLLKDQPEHALALDGFIASSGDRIIYTGKWLGILASFSEQKLGFFVEPLFPPERPVIMENDGSVWLDHGPIPASLAIAADVERFYILTRRRDALDFRSFVDVYSSHSGAYQRSLMLPSSDKWTSLAVGGGYLYAAGLRAIIRWPAAILEDDSDTLESSAGRSIIRLRLNPKIQGR